MVQEPKGQLLDQQKLGFHHLATNGSILSAVNYDGTATLYNLQTQQKIVALGRKSFSGL